MSRFQNEATKVVVSVADSKDFRFGEGWHPYTGEPDAEQTEGEYGTYKVADLRSEIAHRNEGRDEADLIPTEGKKAELVEFLTADDTK